MTNCLIIGSGSNFMEDVESACDIGQIDYVVVVKRVLFEYPGKVDFFVTLHPEWAAEYIQNRYALGWDMKFETYATRNFKIDPRNWDIGKIHIVDEGGWGGSSGLYAIKIIRDRFPSWKIILAGMPLDLTPRFKDNKPWSGGQTGVHRYRRGWQNKFEHYASMTRSMSGWTKRLLGSPTTEWMAT